MQSDSRFRIELISQRWAGPQPELDVCTHGRLQIWINGIALLDPSGDDIGISRTALALSRTLVRDHVHESPVAPRLVFHACGFATILETSCGWGANWWVRHDDEVVRIDGVARFDGNNGRPVVRFPGASCVVPAAQYRREIARLGRATLDFAAASHKTIVGAFDQSDWLGWQVELRRTLRASSARRRHRAVGALRRNA